MMIGGFIGRFIVDAFPIECFWYICTQNSEQFETLGGKSCTKGVATFETGGYPVLPLPLLLQSLHCLCLGRRTVSYARDVCVDW